MLKSSVQHMLPMLHSYKLRTIHEPMRISLKTLQQRPSNLKHLRMHFLILLLDFRMAEEFYPDRYLALFVLHQIPDYWRKRSVRIIASPLPLLDVEAA